MQSIIIADSHNLCREALCDYIRQAEPAYQIGGVGDYPSLRQCVKNSRPDLVLIETDLPGWEGGNPALEFFQQNEAIKFGMIIPMVHERADWGPQIKGVFPKSLSCKAFMGGIGEILSGKTFFPPIKDVVSAMEDSCGFRRGPRDFNLTTREREVLGHLVKGASNKDIARALDLQVVTVKLHVRGICRKMKASNRTQAALMAQENGWG